MQKDFDKWHKLKVIIENREEIFCNTGEIWWCSIGTNIGAENSGKNDLFERPVLVAKVYNKQSILVIPITSQPKDDKYHFHLKYNNQSGWLILSHARTISSKRLQRKLHRVSTKKNEEILEALINLIKE